MRDALVAWLAWGAASAFAPECRVPEAGLLEVVSEAEIPALYGGNGPVAIRGRANLPSATSELLPEMETRILKTVKVFYSFIHAQMHEAKFTSILI